MFLVVLVVVFGVVSPDKGCFKATSGPGLSVNRSTADGDVSASNVFCDVVQVLSVDGRSSRSCCRCAVVIGD